jgi:preprotein translocase subunit SecY
MTMHSKHMDQPLLFQVFLLGRRRRGIFAGIPVFGMSTAVENSFASSTHGSNIAFPGSLSAKTVCALAIIPLAKIIF